MLHTQLHGTHWQIGFQLGAGLARDGHFILDAVPFPITPARLEFARTCLPLCRRWFPAALEELRGLAQGQGCAPDELAGVLFSMYAMPPGPLAAPALPCAGGEGPCSAGTATFSRSWKSTTPTAYTVFRRPLFFCGQHHLLPPDGGRRPISSDWRRDSPRCPQPTPPRAECWSDPAAPAGILPGCSPGPGAAPGAPRLLLPHAGAGRPGWAYRPGGVCPGAHPDPLSRGDGRLRLLRQFLPPLRHGPLPPADGRRLAGGRALSDPHPLPGRLGPGASTSKLDRTCSPAGWASCASMTAGRAGTPSGPCSMTRPPAPSCVRRATPAASPFSQTPGSRFVPDLIRERPSAAPRHLITLVILQSIIIFLQSLLDKFGVT